MILTDRQLQRLEVYLRQLLRQLQNFSDRVANSAVALLIGIPPVAAQLHIRTLTFLGAIMRSEDSALRQIPIRQIAIKDFKAKSWFLFCARLLYKYDLPSIHHLVSFPPTKTYWARLVKRNILSYWESQLQLEGAQKSSMQNLDISKTSFRHPHAVWTTTSCEVKDVTKARVKAKLLTGSYPLHINKAKFRGGPNLQALQLKPRRHLSLPPRMSSLGGPKEEILPTVSSTYPRPGTYPETYT